MSRVGCGIVPTVGSSWLTLIGAGQAAPTLAHLQRLEQVPAQLSPELSPELISFAPWTHLWQEPSSPPAWEHGRHASWRLLSLPLASFCQVLVRLPLGLAAACGRLPTSSADPLQFWPGPLGRCGAACGGRVPWWDAQERWQRRRCPGAAGGRQWLRSLGQAQLGTRLMQLGQRRSRGVACWKHYSPRGPVP